MLDMTVMIEKIFTQISNHPHVQKHNICWCCVGNGGCLDKNVHLRLYELK